MGYEAKVVEDDEVDAGQCCQPGAGAAPSL
jgi:hypothetical protein